MSKVHRHLAASTLELVSQIMFHGQSAEQLVQSTLKANPRWGSRDRKFVSSTVYEMIRHWRKWVFAGGGKDEDVWLAWAAYWLAKGEHLPAFPELEAVNPEVIQARLAAPMPLAIQESLPDWWMAKGERDFGPHWPSLLRALNTPASVYLRVNTLKTTRDALIAELNAKQVEARPVAENPLAVQLAQRPRLADFAFWREGRGEVQDLGSQGIGGFFPLQPGQWVVDLCAGAGGKTLQLAARMANTGALLACDVVEHKLAELAQRCQRAGVSIMQTKVMDPMQLAIPPAWLGKADVVLIDAPCSGSGVLRRLPDTKWKLTEARIATLQAIQARLLQQAVPFLKPGGRLIYATCSLFAEENEHQTRQFLTQHPNFTLVQEKRWLPHELDCDGFYAAEMRIGSEGE